MRFRVNYVAGFLCYTGDMGTFVFRRLEDMFAFFRTRSAQAATACSINLGYWAESTRRMDRDGQRRSQAADKFTTVS